MKDSLVVDMFQSSPNLYTAIVKIPVSIVNRFFENAIESIAKKNINGFNKSETPKNYVRQNFTQNITNIMKEFFFKYFVVSKIYKEIRSKKIALVGDLRLIDCQLTPNKEAQYHLEFNFIQTKLSKEWKYISFKSSQRKKYKDIDKQASEFIKQEEDREKRFTAKGIIHIGDWVNFSIVIIGENKKPLFDKDEIFWIKIGQDDTSIPFQEIFLGKKIGESFHTDHPSMQDYFNSNSSMECHFLIKILDIVHRGFLSLENFKKHFKIKTNKKTHEKIVEVFSFTNDMSLRRNITDEAFQTLFKIYPISVPLQCILRQQQVVVEHLQKNPDYIVYRTEPGFKDKTKQLAEQQIKEIGLMELLAHYEDLDSTDEDVKNYITLTQRARTREFIHFTHSDISHATEVPIHAESLKQAALREKALNHAIFYLTKL